MNTMANSSTNAAGVQAPAEKAVECSAHPKQCIANLPAEIRQLKRFFPVAENKHPKLTAWQNPENQKLPEQVEGLKGFALGDDYLLVDFDHVTDGNGKFLYHEAERWYNYLASLDDDVFCERSISGEGLHILLKPTAGKFPKITNAANGFEVLG